MDGIFADDEIGSQCIDVLAGVCCHGIAISKLSNSTGCGAHASAANKPAAPLPTHLGRRVDVSGAGTAAMGGNSVKSKSRDQSS